MFSILNNIPTVTKNLLILNIFMFILTVYFESQQIDLGAILGAHYINSPLFEPYQIVSHFFMHSGFQHIFFNMFGLVMFGGILEKLWGPKRFFIFYIASAIGAFALYNIIGASEIMHLKQQITATNMDINHINNLIADGNLNAFNKLPFLSQESYDVAYEYFAKCSVPMVGASGAIFGIMAAFAILFPNTELQLMFIPVPVKAKWLIGAYFAYELYSSFYETRGDHIAHLAHVGGAIVGAILVLFWRKSRTHFY